MILVTKRKYLSVEDLLPGDPLYLFHENEEGNYEIVWFIFNHIALKSWNRTCNLKM